MADVTSSAAELEVELREFVAGFNFRSPGRDQSLGRDIAVLVAEGIVDRTVVEGRDATGGPLKPNAAKYAADKARRHDVHQPGILTGQTLSLASVLGTPQIGEAEIDMRYGTGEPPTRYSTRGTITGKEPTDREKAGYLTDQGRSFYSLDDSIAEGVIELAGEALDDYIARTH